MKVRTRVTSGSNWRSKAICEAQKKKGTEAHWCHNTRSLTQTGDWLLTDLVNDLKPAGGWSSNLDLISFVWRQRKQETLLSSGDWFKLIWSLLTTWFSYFSNQTAAQVAMAADRLTSRRQFKQRCCISLMVNDLWPLTLIITPGRNQFQTSNQSNIQDAPKVSCCPDS